MDEFLKRWSFVRSETIELLDSLDDEQLVFKPEGAKWQALYFQFGCMGRTQLVYAMAAETGVMDFSLFGSKDLPSKIDNQAKASLASFLKTCNDKWIEAISHNTAGVKWPDGSKPIELHVATLAEHERLHHGQLISYFTLAGFDLPANFKRNWAL